MCPIGRRKRSEKKSRQLRVLQGLPGVGPDRAKGLLERFKTVRACFSASAVELMEVGALDPRRLPRSTTSSIDLCRELLGFCRTHILPGGTGSVVLTNFFSSRRD